MTKRTITNDAEKPEWTAPEIDVMQGNDAEGGGSTNADSNAAS